MRRRCDSDKCAFSTDKLQSILPSIFFIFYRRRAAREQYLCRFIVTAQRGNNIFAFLSSPCSAETIFCHFIVTVRRGNDIFAFLSSPRRAGTIFFRFIVAVQRGNDIFPFYRHRSAREQYFAILSSPCSVPANASATPLRQIIRASGRQTRRKC